MKSKRLRAWLIRAIGLALFVIILKRIDLGHALGLLKRAEPLTLAGAALLIFPMMALKTSRWRWLQGAAGLGGGGYFRSLLAYFTGMYAGLITPGRVGEFVRVKYLTDQGAPLPEAMSTVIVDRVIDVAGLLFLGSLALWPMAGQFRSLYLGVLGLLALVTVGGVLFIYVDIPGSGRLQRLWDRPLAALGRVGEVVKGTLSSSRELLRRLRPGVLGAVLLVTLLGWAVYYAQAFLLARTLGIPLAFLPLVVTVTAAAVAAFLPVSISGLGTRDAAMVALFAYFGRPSEEAVALSALVFLVLIANALLGLMASQLLDYRGGGSGATAH